MRGRLGELPEGGLEQEATQPFPCESITGRS